MKLLAAIVVTSALLVSIADAATRVVAGSHPQAADTNAGTADKPLRTISAAVSKAQAGDTVVVMPGRYPEQVKIDNEGHPLRGWLMIAAGGGERKRWKGKGVRERKRCQAPFWRVLRG